MALKILLADDSMVAQSMGKKILTDAGYEVAVVSNGAAALKQLPEVQPDIILLDVYMPGYTGLEVCQMVKSAPETARTPVLLTVGMLEPFRPEDGIRARADGVIVKPFEATDLIALVAKIAERIPLERRQAAGMARATAPAAEPSTTASGAPPPVHAKGREFPQLNEVVAEEAPHVPSSPFATAQAMVEQAEAAAPAVVPEPGFHGATAAQGVEQARAAQEVNEGKEREEHETDQHGTVLKGAEVAAGVAASALAAMSWKEILSGGPKPPASGEAAETPAEVQKPELAPQEDALKAAMYGSAAVAKEEPQRFPPMIAETETAAMLPDLEPTSAAFDPAAVAAAANVAALPELWRFDGAPLAVNEEQEKSATDPAAAAQESVTAPEAGESAAAEPVEAAEIVAEAAPELAESRTVTAEPEEDFLQIEDETQAAEAQEEVTPAAAADAPELAPALEALTAEESASGAEPRVEVEADSGPDAAALALAEQIVDRVLQRVRPELVKEVARLVN